MKKFICALSALAMLFTACDKPNNGNGNTTSGGDEDYVEITLSCSVDLMEGIETNNYGTCEMVMPGEKILEFFDMTAEEFYHAMGTYTGDAGSTSQVDNTISFGVCTGNNTENMNFCPSSSNNFGCWIDANAAVCTWGDDAVLYHESVIEWGLDEPEQETLDAMWTFACGFFPNHNSYKAGDVIKTTYFFQRDAQDADDKDRYCYVEMIMNVVAAATSVEPVDASKMKDVTIDVSLSIPDSPSYDASAQILEALQVPADKVGMAASLGQIECKRYIGDVEVAQNAGGIVGNWFNVAGEICNWGTVDEETELPLFAYYIEAYDNFHVGSGINDALAADLAGKTISGYKQTISYTAAGKTATATLNYTITFNTAE